MAAKTPGTWVPHEPAGIRDLTEVGTTQLYDLGRRCKAFDKGSTGYGHGEFVYCKGVTSTAAGSVVLIKSDYTTSLVAARDKGALGVALGANDANTKFGWYQILGQGVALCDTGVVADAPLYIDGTTGRVDDTVVAGDQVIGMRAVSTDDTNTCVVSMNAHPATADFDNT